MSDKKPGLIDAMAHAIYDADVCAEPWKTFETLHPEDADHYRQMAEAALEAWQTFRISAVLDAVGVR